MDMNTQATSERPASIPAEQSQEIGNKSSTEAQTAGEEKPAEDAPQAETEDQEKIPGFVKKKMRNLERSLRHALQKRGELEERLRATENRGSVNYQSEQDDSEPVSLTRAELDRMVREEAKRLAPALKDQESVMERRAKVAEGLAKTWGQDGFNQRAQDLDAAFNGLTVGKDPKPAVDAIFEADDAAAVIDYLTDPDNADEADAISRMGAVQAGRAIAKLESKLAEAKKAGGPKPSKAPAPIEADRGRGKINVAPDPKDTKAWMRWMNEQEAKGIYR